MKSKPLFDDEIEFRPDPDLTEPTIWIRRLLVLERKEPGLEPVREVEFRCGLNIIATEIPPEGETRPVGHNVGKTLLTRLIRYALGESHYARQSVRAAVGREFPHGFVLAEIIVGGELWTVARPLGLELRPKSMAWRGLPWQDALSADSANAYSEFMEVLESLTVRRFAGVTLPGQGRATTWRDVLGWLSRDQHCAYRDPLEWRSKWTESGTPELDAEDSSLIVRLAMDLVDTEEGRLIQQRKALLGRKQSDSKALSDKSTELARTRQFLSGRLPEADDLLNDDLFAATAAKQLAESIKAIEAEIEELPKVSGLSELTVALETANDAVRALETTIELRDKDRKIEERQQKTNQNATGDELLERLADQTSGCPISRPDCPFHSENEQARERQAYRTALVQDSVRRIAGLDQEITALTEELQEKMTERDVLQARHESLSGEVGKKLEPLQRRLSELASLRDEVEGFHPLRNEVEELRRSIENTDLKLDKLRDKQRAHAERNTDKLRKLNESLRVVQRRLVGSDANPSIRIGISRLTFSGNDDEPSPGEGMATSSTLSLDLACLRAGLEGLGFLPRLLIHDSPRGGDLEPHLYANLFHLALELEAAFAAPPFQYILATTTRPPESLLAAPYLRCLLDARAPHGLLLERFF